MNYRTKFASYAPELGAAIAAIQDQEWQRDLNEAEPTSAAFDVCEAFTVFWSQWHGGQSSRLYSLGSRFCSAFEFRPSHALDESTLEGYALDLFHELHAAFNCPLELTEARR